ncbi:hypothetical protein T492DRAFT_1036995 [Pavlovales sp. CCMP2436]|nr:hypothetical protein T492DRAFT_1036995 [Pavlovales sp. CCMP2436]
MLAMACVAACAFARGPAVELGARWHPTLTFRDRAQVAMEFGDSFYSAHDAPPPFGPKSGDPTLPKNVFEIYLPRPLGIQFEEQDKRGLKVISLISGGNADRCGKLQVGDQLVGVTAVRMVGSKFERQMFDCSKWTFDTVVDAIGSNEERFNCEDVVLQLLRPPA